MSRPNRWAETPPAPFKILSWPEGRKLPTEDTAYSWASVCGKLSGLMDDNHFIVVKENEQVKLRWSRDGLK